ncbi:MAG: hypothetical protein IPK63_09955 [Candidatus Competibacteraceae bacterium]|mgnify:CR=1 FL=1|nr:hypothetical protein [Candidatus Competibacteraceae bacterium]
MLQRLSRQSLTWFGDPDRAALVNVVADFRELAARRTEQTNRNFYAVSLFTALLFPPSLIAGMFGMNVAGLPGLQDGAAFW